MDSKGVVRYGYWGYHEHKGDYVLIKSQLLSKNKVGEHQSGKVPLNKRRDGITSLRAAIANTKFGRIPGHVPESTNNPNHPCYFAHDGVEQCTQDFEYLVGE